MKYMRRTAGYIWTDYKTNAQIAKELKITPILDKLLEYKRNWIQHVNRMPRNRLPMVMKRYSPSGRRNHGRPLKRLLDTWDRNGSTSGPTPWQIDDNDDDDDDYLCCVIFYGKIVHGVTIKMFRSHLMTRTSVAPYCVSAAESWPLRRTKKVIRSDIRVDFEENILSMNWRSILYSLGISNVQSNNRIA